MKKRTFIRHKKITAVFLLNHITAVLKNLKTGLPLARQPCLAFIVVLSF